MLGSFSHEWSDDGCILGDVTLGEGGARNQGSSRCTMATAAGVSTHTWLDKLALNSRAFDLQQPLAGQIEGQYSCWRQIS
ncbi:MULTISPECIES: hypothetical protein [Pseudomonas]|uniref:Uncharacterized protein n=1 Tax=Pseudomonas quercus TaxID=2722792 RepID=A0ABX0YCL2_9PSED|nr:MULTISPECIES: hypothetical protein [Pseudomonas]MBF7142449.1 hypothetical protein [Pseudomonas sp. LY10J]NJP00987.1 hypothetical protein [Pseudomonas quercus]